MRERDALCVCGTHSFVHSCFCALCMARFDLRDFKKQASFFLREKLNDARLVLTDVSRIQLLTEEATNEDAWGPETRTMAILADAAFELEEYERIVQVLHGRLDPSKKRPWRQLYKTLVVLEYLLTHGPNSIGREFRGDLTCMEELSQFNFTDQQGIDRGSTVRTTADRVLELVSNPDFRKDERIRVNKISVGIQGFGSKRSQESCQSEVIEQGGAKDFCFKEAFEVGNAAKKSTQPGLQHVPNVNGAAMNLQQTQEFSSNPLSEKSTPASAKILEGKGQMMLFKKSLSSPSLLRTHLPYLKRQPVDDRKNELEGVNTCLLDAAEDTDSFSCNGLRVERDQPGKLMRRIPEESTEERMTEDERVKKSLHEDTLSRFEGVDTFCFAASCKSAVQKCEGEQLFSSFPNCDNLPYAAHSESRVKFQNQQQLSSLIDCSSKF